MSSLRRKVSTLRERSAPRSLRIFGGSSRSNHSQPPSSPSGKASKERKESALEKLLKPVHTPIGKASSASSPQRAARLVDRLAEIADFAASTSGSNISSPRRLRRCAVLRSSSRSVTRSISTLKSSSFNRASTSTGTRSAKQLLSGKAFLDSVAAVTPISGESWLHDEAEINTAAGRRAAAFSAAKETVQECTSNSVELLEQRQRQVLSGDRAAIAHVEGIAALTQHLQVLGGQNVPSGLAPADKVAFCISQVAALLLRIQGEAKAASDLTKLTRLQALKNLAVGVWRYLENQDQHDLPEVPVDLVASASSDVLPQTVATRVIKRETVHVLIKNKISVAAAEWKLRSLLLTRTSLTIESLSGQIKKVILLSAISKIAYCDSDKDQQFSFSITYSSRSRNAAKTLTVSCSGREQMALWMVSIEGMGKRAYNADCEWISTEERNAIFMFLYKENTSGGVIRSNDGIAYEYNSTGELTRSVDVFAHRRKSDEDLSVVSRGGADEDEDEEAIVYFWDGYELSPKHSDSPDLGTGVWNGVQLWWLRRDDGSQAAETPFLSFVFNSETREFENVNPNVSWRWDGRDFTQRAPSGGAGGRAGNMRTWSVDGSVPEPIVMMAQCLEFYRDCN